MPQYGLAHNISTALRSFRRPLLRATLVVGFGAALRSFVLWLRRIEIVPTTAATEPITPDQVQPQLRRIIVSDLHLGGGDRLDDFDADGVFADFVHSYVVNSEATELILAGDTIEFLQIRLDDVADDDWSEQAALQRLQQAEQSHARVFAALRYAIARGVVVTWLIGNHDFDLHYPALKAAIRRSLGASDERQLRFGLSYHGGGIYLVHGNQYDAWNRFTNFASISEPYEVVRGSRLVKEVINQLELDPIAVAPLIDNVKPTSAFFWYLVALPRLRNRQVRRFVIRGVLGFLQIWLMPHAYRLGKSGFRIQDSETRAQSTEHRAQSTEHRAQSTEHRAQNREPGNLATWELGNQEPSAENRAPGNLQSAICNLQSWRASLAENVLPPDAVLDQMQSEASRQLRREVRKFTTHVAREMVRLAQRSDLADCRYFICGHTHLAGVVPISAHQYYINTGTWTEIIYDVGTMLRQEQRYPFCEVRYPEGDTPDAQLLVWNGSAEAPDRWQEGALPRRRLRLV